MSAHRREEVSIDTSPQLRMRSRDICPSTTAVRSTAAGCDCGAIDWSFGRERSKHAQQKGKESLKRPERLTARRRVQQVRSPGV